MLLKSPPPGETSPQATEGVHFPCGDPAEGLQVGRLVPGLHIKGLSNKSPDRCRRRGFTVLPLTGGIINSLPLKGKRLTTFCVSLTLLQNVFAVHRKAAIHNPRAIGPSNLKTLRPQGPVHLKNLFHNLFLQPFYTTRRRQAATTFGPEGRQPFPSQPFYTTYGEAVPLCA